MNEVATEKKGMSKGCLVGLIVLGVLIVVVVVLGIVCYTQKDSIMKFGVNTMISEVKAQVANNPEADIDTVQFNALADAFAEKFNAEEIDMEKMGAMAQVIQGIIEDKVVDSAEVGLFIDAMVDYYPELEEMLPDEPMMEYDTTMVDSIMEEMEETE